MKKIFGIFIIFFIFLFSSCDVWPHWIWFDNRSSYKISVKCDITDPSSFTLYPGDDLMVEYKSPDMTYSSDTLKINLKNNENDFVSVSVDMNGWVVFKNK